MSPMRSLVPASSFRRSAALQITAGSALLALSWLTGASTAQATGFVSGQVVVEMVPGGSIDAINNLYGTTTLDAYPEADLYLLQIPGGSSEWTLVQQLLLEPTVADVEENFIQETPEGIRQMVISATGGTLADYEDQTVTQRIGLDEAHLTSTGSGVVVAVLDSGIDATHPALLGRVLASGYDFVDDDADPSEVFNGIDDDGDGLVDDGYGHGTMVAGIIALIAPDAQILPIRVLDDEGRGDAYRIAKALRYAQLNGAQLVNMSFGIPQNVSIIGHQLSILNAGRIRMVAGAGNENRDNPPYFPADHSKVFMVTAVDSNDAKASFADYNSKVLVSAPGTGIRSAFPGGGWALGDGCSFAAPFVTGEIALILTLHPGIPLEPLELLLESGVVPIDSLPGNLPFAGELGTGRIHLPTVLNAAVTAVPGDGGSGAIRLLASPNPTRGSVHFSPASGEDAGARWTLEIFDLRGRRVLRREDLSLGQLEWRGRDEAGSPVASGVYFARVTGNLRTPAVTRIVLSR